MPPGGTSAPGKDLSKPPDDGEPASRRLGLPLIEAAVQPSAHERAGLGSGGRTVGELGGQAQGPGQGQSMVSDQNHRVRVHRGGRHEGAKAFLEARGGDR